MRVSRLLVNCSSCWRLSSERRPSVLAKAGSELNSNRLKKCGARMVVSVVACLSLRPTEWAKKLRLSLVK